MKPQILKESKKPEVKITNVESYHITRYWTNSRISSYVGELKINENLDDYGWEYYKRLSATSSQYIGSESGYTTAKKAFDAGNKFAKEYITK